MIGTNGAGKSTLINMLSGEMPAIERQRSQLRGDDITALVAAAARARRHRPQLPAHDDLPEFTVLENCRLAAQARAPRPWTSGGAGGALRRSAAAAARRARRGGPRRARRAHRRRAATARSASSRSRCAWRRAPRVLLLDEPLAGMGAEETERMLALLAGLKRGTRCCWSSTTWTRCSASPTGSR